MTDVIKVRGSASSRANEAGNPIRSAECCRSRRAAHWRRTESRQFERHPALSVEGKINEPLVQEGFVVRYQMPGTFVHCVAALLCSNACFL